MTRKTKANAGEWQPAFLAALREMPVIRAACHEAGITRAAAYLSREKDEKFRAEWDQALADGIDKLEEALHQRGRERDTTAAIFMLKNLRPEKFADRRQLELTGAGGGPIQVQPVKPEDLSDETIERILREAGRKSLADGKP